MERKHREVSWWFEGGAGAERLRTYSSGNPACGMDPAKKGRVVIDEKATGDFFPTSEEAFSHL